MPSDPRPSRGFGFLSGAVTVFAFFDFLRIEAREPRPVTGLIGIVLAVCTWIMAKGGSDD